MLLAPSPMQQAYQERSLRTWEPYTKLKVHGGEALMVQQAQLTILAVEVQALPWDVLHVASALLVALEVQAEDVLAHLVEMVHLCVEAGQDEDGLAE